MDVSNYTRMALPLFFLFAFVPVFAQLTVVGETSRDVGVFPATESKTAEFSIRNDGTTPTRITSARPGCGACTNVAYSTDPIPPQGSTTVTVTTKPGRLSGKFERQVILQSDTPNQPILRLTITGEAKHDVDAAPATAAGGKSTNGIKTAVTAAGSAVDEPTPAEQRRRALQRLQAIDLNGDGIISPREAESFKKKQESAREPSLPPSL